MKICAIITEYNPFHLGHEFQIKETKKQLGVDFVIVLMSGNFVQRGEPAIFDKYTRTQLALRGGADIVIELPTIFATSSAETFSYGAIELLNKLGNVDYLCFGSEIGELSPMIKLADFLLHEPANFKNALKSELKKGLSYAKARNNALHATFNQETDNTYNHDHLLKGSNNILAIEYLKSLKLLNSSIKPYTIKRIGASYLSQSFEDILPSASAIRKFIFEQSSSIMSWSSSLEKAMPKPLLDYLVKQDDFTPIFMDDLFPTFKYLLEITNIDVINSIYDFPEELFNRLNRIAKTCHHYSNFIDLAVTKNYTKTTIQRALMHLYLQITQEDLSSYKKNGNGYCHILGFKKEASSVLQEIKKNEKITIITNVKDHQKQLSPFYKQMLLNELKYTNLYNQLIYNRYRIQKKNDYQEQIIVLHN